MAQIFISHASPDNALAAEILAWLEAQGIVSTFLDFDAQQGIAAGADWERVLYRELTAAQAILLVVTNRWLASKWCFVEFAQARALGKAIFPLVCEAVPQGSIASDLQKLDLTKDRDDALSRLGAELHRLLSHTHGGFPWDPHRAPYPGLLSFAFADAAIYFGRDQEVRQLMERLNARRAQGGVKLVVVLGASGSGKSSLVRAGVLPRLDRSKESWIVVPPIRLRNAPLDELALALATAAKCPETWREKLTLLGDAESLSGFARDLRAAQNRPSAEILITIDQAEELYPSAGEHPGRTVFFQVLNRLLDAKLPFLVLMTLRSDFLGRLQQDKELTAPFEPFGLKPLQPDRIRDIILGPAAVAGLHVEPALVDAVQLEAHGNDVLPLIAFALRELYDRHHGSGGLTAAAYHALGDPAAGILPLENAVRRKADEVVNDAAWTAEDLLALRDAFVSTLVRVNQEGEYVRRTARMEEIPVRARPLLEKLAQARLLTMSGEGNDTLVEVAHEALIRKWPRLRAWLDEEREFLLGKDQLERDMAEWTAAATARKADALLTGLKLARAHAWLLSRPHQLTAAERDFITQSQAAHVLVVRSRERTRRRILLGAVLSAAILLVLLAAAVWQTYTADSLRLASQAIEHVHDDLGLAMTEAVESASRSHTHEAETALNAVLSAGATERLILHHGSPLESAAYAPNGQFLASAADDGSVRLWNAGTGKLRATLRGHSASVLRLAFSRDSAMLASGGADGSLCVWDTASGNPLWTQKAHAASLTALEFSPQGDVLVSASVDHTARLWNARSGQQVWPPLDESAPIDLAAFLADGTTIVLMSRDGEFTLWNSTDGTTRRPTLPFPSAQVAAMLTPDRERLLVMDQERQVRLWDVRGNALLPPAVPLDKTFHPRGIAPDDSTVASSSPGGDVALIELAQGFHVRTLAGHTAEVTSASFSRDGSRLLTASRDRSAKLWDVTTGALLANLTGSQQAVVSAEFSPDGREILTASSDGTARIWQLGDARLAPPLIAAQGHRVFAFLPADTAEGIRVLTSNGNGFGSILDGNGKTVATLAGSADALAAGAFSESGTRAVTANSNGLLQLWDTSSGQPVGSPFGPEDGLSSVAFSADASVVVSAGFNGAQRWSTVDRKPLPRLASDGLSPIESAHFSRDGNFLVTGNMDRQATIWDLANPRRVPILLSGRHSGPVLDAGFSPDGKRIVTAGLDHTARIWDSHSGAHLFDLDGHTGTIFSAEYSLDGTKIVTASDDHTVRLWDAASGRQIASVAVPSAGSPHAEFTPDGRAVVASASAGRLVILRTGFDDLLQWAKQHVPVDVRP
jgi:WD40 repeat protein